MPPRPLLPGPSLAPCRSCRRKWEVPRARAGARPSPQVSAAPSPPAPPGLRCVPSSPVRSRGRDAGRCVRGGRGRGRGARGGGRGCRGGGAWRELWGRAWGSRPGSGTGVGSLTGGPRAVKGALAGGIGRRRQPPCGGRLDHSASLPPPLTFRDRPRISPDDLSPRLRRRSPPGCGARLPLASST